MMKRHPWRDPQVGDELGWERENLLESEPELRRVVTLRDGDLVGFTEHRGARTRETRVTLRSWTGWCYKRVPYILKRVEK